MDLAAPKKKVHFLSLSFTSVGKNKENKSYPSFSHVNLKRL
jgi:hypothetical protein